MNAADETLLRIAEGFLIPPHELLNGLTGDQWVELRNTYNRLPTPLERIEVILSLIQFTVSTAAAAGGSENQEFKGSIIPSRFDLWADADADQTQQEEDAIIANMHLHMLYQNAVRGYDGNSSQIQPPNHGPV